MPKTQKPLLIACTDPALKDHLHIFEERGDNVIIIPSDTVEVPDAYIGSNCLYTQPETIKMTFDAVEKIRKGKPKPPKKGKGK